MNGPLDNLLIPASTARGFTHLDLVGLIHMNGRVYDPELGRFMSADPFVQAPYNSQSYNRYSYVFNNPLSYTDPTGYQAESDCHTDPYCTPGKRPPADPCQYSMCGQDAIDFGQDWQRQVDRSLTLFIEKSVDWIGVPTIFNATVETYIQVQNGDYAGALQTAAEGGLEFGSKKIKTAGNVAESATDLLKKVKAAEKKANKALKNSEFVDLTGHRKDHILNRHRAGSNKADKTEFPASWSDEKLLHFVSDVATDPKVQKGMGKWDSPYSIGERDGVMIRVDFYPNNHPKYAGQISTAYPLIP